MPNPNFSITTQTGFATDTYIVGSGITVPNRLPVIGTMYKCLFNISKTAAGTAAPVVSFRIGLNGTTGDPARCVFTFSAGSAVADSGTVEVFVTLRTIGTGTSATVQGVCQINHNLDSGGFINLASETISVSSGGFNSTVPNGILGVSLNAGAGANWSVDLVQAWLYNM